MYKLSRLLLILALLLGSYSLAIFIVAGWPATGYMMVIMMLLRVARKRHVRLTTLGRARWADESDLRRAGMVGAPSGLILGRLPARSRFGWKFGQLLKGNLSATALGPGLWAKEAPLIRLPQAIHTLVVGPTGGGKGVSIVIPTLKTFSESCVVLDLKGEAARLTAHLRHAMGHKVVLLDPYQMVTQRPDQFNPLDFIDKDNPQAIDECNDLANALVIRSSGEKEPHWADSAEAYIAAITAMVVNHGSKERGSRSLATVREVLSHPKKLEMAIKLMTESDAWGGHLAQMGGQLMHFVDKEKSSVLSSALRHVRFLGTPAISTSTACSTFNPADLRNGRMTVFLILGPEHLRAQAGLMRLWVGSLLRSCVRGGLQS
jgi:type IV secretion system protein VirD4